MTHSQLKYSLLWLWKNRKTNNRLARRIFQKGCVRTSHVILSIFSLLYIEILIQLTESPSVINRKSLLLSHRSTYLFYNCFPHSQNFQLTNLSSVVYDQKIIDKSLSIRAKNWVYLKRRLLLEINYSKKRVLSNISHVNQFSKEKTENYWSVPRIIHFNKQVVKPLDKSLPK